MATPRGSSRRPTARRARRALHIADLVERRTGTVGVSVGKGYVIELCVRGLSPPELLHVFLHELAHTASLSVGHTNEHALFEQTLQQSARNAGHKVSPPLFALCNLSGDKH